MAKSNTWKQSERDAAETIGGTRIPVTGRHSGDVPDIEHNFFAIEHKYGKRVISATIKKALSQARKASRNKYGGCFCTDKMPIVTIEQAAGPGKKNERLVMLDIDDFVSLWKDTNFYRFSKVEK
tara:strand:+ start:2835 stop:3206 length:372 start_codon:yes stop_codon:yes gene_type:complete